MSIQSDVQKLEPGALVSLYTLDTTPISGTTIVRFTSGRYGDSDVVLGGLSYTPMDVEVSGFSWDGRGSFPRPTLRVSNIGGFVSGLLATEGDIVGSTFTRVRTFAQYLDNGDTPDPTAAFPEERFTVNQRTNHTKTFIEWELASVFEYIGVGLPRRQCIRDVCTHTYRKWDGSAFDTTNTSCPYTGTDYFDEQDNPVAAPSDDKCSKTLAGCRLRFGGNSVLPTRQFPGITKQRI